MWLRYAAVSDDNGITDLNTARGERAGLREIAEIRGKIRRELMKLSINTPNLKKRLLLSLWPRRTTSPSFLKLQTNAKVPPVMPDPTRATLVLLV